MREFLGVIDQKSSKNCDLDSRYSQIPEKNK